MPDVKDFELPQLVKKKYYNASRVDMLFEDMNACLSASRRECAALKEQLELLSAQKIQISDTLLSARDIAAHIIADANAQAEEKLRMAKIQAEDIVAAAEKKGELILSDSKCKRAAADADFSQLQDHALRCVEDCISKLRQQSMDSIELINAQWQSFLSGLIINEDEDSKPEPETLPVTQPPVDWMAIASMELPDIGEQYADIEEQYADIDADTFFSGGFFGEQSGSAFIEQELEKLRGIMDSIDMEKEGFQ